MEGVDDAELVSSSNRWGTGDRRGDDGRRN